MILRLSGERPGHCAGGFAAPGQRDEQLGAWRAAMSEHSSTSGITDGLDKPRFFQGTEIDKVCANL
ncbi:hypothetical protein CS8_024810 [Cupriavidus sp. 8B]